MSVELCKKTRICTATAPYKAQHAKKSTEKLRVPKNKVILDLGGYTGCIRIAANPLNYDVILGKKWCAKQKAKTDCENNLVEILHGDKLLIIKALHDFDL